MINDPGNNTSRETESRFSPVRLLFVLASAIFAVDWSTMVFYNYISSKEPVFEDHLLESLLLIAVLYPVLYLLVLRPTLFHIRERRRAEKDLRKAHDELELKIAERTTELRDSVEALHLEIDQRRKTAEKVSHLTRLYSVLGSINEVIVRVRESDKLYEEVCRIAVEEGLFQMAWVGLLDPDSRFVKPVAVWGNDQGYLDGIKVSIDDTPEGGGPIGTAIRQGRYYVCTDIEHDPSMLPWRDEALRRGFRSSAAFYLRVENDIIGTISFYSGEVFFFDDEEIQLLLRLATNISFALESIEHERRRRLAEEALLLANAELDNRVQERTADLAKTNDRLRLLVTVLESAANAIVITDADGVINWVNPAFTTLTGFTSGDVMGQKASILKSGKHDETFYRGIRETVWAGQVWHGEIINRRKNGSFYTEEMTITPVLDASGQLSNFVAIKQDVSERKEVERLKNEFISIVSHELRTPLTSIRGSLSLIAGGVAGELSSQARSLTEIALRNTERLVRLINDILDIEKISAGKMVFNVQVLELMPLIEQAIEANAGYGEELRVRFVLDEVVPGVRVKVDADRFMQVMTNLLSNAAKFSPADDVVIVAVTRHDGCCRISVTDHGPGIPAAFHNSIFEAFVQADSSDTRQKGGTGLGLSIARAIVEKLDGDIGFRTKENEGTTFYVDLPEFKDMAAIAPREQPRILICEDDRDVAALLNMVLAREGFDTDVAYNTSQAKHLLGQHRYAAMTLDLRLPYEAGTVLLKELRENIATRDLPVIVISASATEAREQIDGGDPGVIEWLDKPVDIARLMAAIKRIPACDMREKPEILYVEDEYEAVALVRDVLAGAASVVQAPTLRQAKEMLSQRRFDLVMLDLVLPDGTGLELLPHLRDEGRNLTPVVIYTGHVVDDKLVKDADAVLVKSHTSPRLLVDTITSLIGSKKYARKG